MVRMKSKHYNSFEYWVTIDSVYGCPIFKWVAATLYEYNCSRTVSLAMWHTSLLPGINELCYWHIFTNTFLLSVQWYHVVIPTSQAMGDAPWRLVSTTGPLPDSPVILATTFMVMQCAGVNSMLPGAVHKPVVNVSVCLYKHFYTTC